MGAASCSASPDHCTSCGQSARPSSELPREYEPQGKSAALKESVEPGLASVTAFGRSMEARFHSGSAAKGMEQHMHNVEAAVMKSVQDATQAEVSKAAGNAANDAMHNVSGILPKFSGGQLQALEEADRDADTKTRDVAAVQEKGGAFNMTDPSIQAAAYAVNRGTASAKAELLEMSDYIHRSHCSLRMFCFSVAIALLASSVIGLLNLFGVVQEPFQYLMSVYNVVFASVIIVIDGQANCFIRCADHRTKLFRAVWCLSTVKGRALFYFYVGSMNLAVLGEGNLRIVHLGVGACLVVAGLWILSDGFGCCPYRRKPTGLAGAAEKVQHQAAHVIDAVHEAGTTARMEYLMIRSYVQHHPCSLKIIVFFVSLALLVFSVLGMINIFSAFIHPFQYLVCCYNVLFSIALILLDGRAEWFEKCWDGRKILLQGAPCLGWLVGRAAFCFYVGSLNLALLPESAFWQYIYMGIGGSLCAAGVSMLLHRYVCRSAHLDDILGKPGLV